MASELLDRATQTVSEVQQDTAIGSHTPAFDIGVHVLVPFEDKRNVERRQLAGIYREAQWRHLCESRALLRKLDRPGRIPDQ